jgi:hypothetical protein
MSETVTQLTNQYRREAIALWNLRSSYRQYLYIKARLQGKSAKQAIGLSRGGKRP